MYAPSSPPLVRTSSRQLPKSFESAVLIPSLCSVHRPQRNNHFLLYLHDADTHLAHPRLGRHSSWLGRLPLLHGSAERFHLCALHLSAHKRLCRLPALRGWHHAVCLAAARVFDWHVPAVGRDLDLDIQEQSWARTNEYCGLVCSVIPV